MRQLLVAMLLMLGLAVTAQPGYMGKKLIIQYQPTFNINFDGVTKNGNAKLITPDAIHHGAFIEYVMGRRLTLGLKGARCKNRTALSSSSVDPIYLYDSEKALGDLVEYNTDLVLRRYKNKGGNLAPYGTYLQLALSKHWYTMYSQKFDQKLYANSNIYGFSIAWGKQRVYRDFLVLDLNFKITIMKTFKPDVPEKFSSMVDQVRSHIIAQNLVGFNIGLGYLAPKLGKK